MEKGDIVLIKARQGAPGVRRIWDPQPERPFVCHEVYWERWERYQLAPVCWQVSKGQLYQPDIDLARRLDEAYAAQRDGAPEAGSRLEELWEQARPL